MSSKHKEETIVFVIKWVEMQKKKKNYETFINKYVA